MQKDGAALKNFVKKFRFLGLQPSFHKKVVWREYRELVLIHHPDRGAYPEQFRTSKHALNKIESCMLDMDRRLPEVFRNIN